MRRAGHLAGRRGIDELARVGPQQHRQSALVRRPARRRVERGRQLHAVGARVGDELGLHAEAAAPDRHTSISGRREPASRPRIAICGGDVRVSNRVMNTRAVVRQQRRAPARRFRSSVWKMRSFAPVLRLNRSRNGPIALRRRCRRRPGRRCRRSERPLRCPSRAPRAAACPDCCRSPPSCDPTACAASRPAHRSPRCVYVRVSRSFSVTRCDPPVGPRHAAGSGTRSSRARRADPVNGAASVITWSRKSALGLRIAAVERFGPGERRRHRRNASASCAGPSARRRSAHRRPSAASASVFTVCADDDPTTCAVFGKRW